LAAGKVTAQVMEPYGTPLLWSAGGATRLSIPLSGSDLDLRITQTGTYTLLFGAADVGTGTVTVTASIAVDAGALAAGSPKTVALNRPGQDASMTFAGTAGQRLTVDFIAYDFDYSPYVEVYRPDGSVLTAGTLPYLPSVAPPRCAPDTPRKRMRAPEIHIRHPPGQSAREPKQQRNAPKLTSPN